MIDKVISNYLEKYFSNKLSSDTTIDNCRYYKLPYIGKYSKVTKQKVKELVERFCKDIDLRLIFTTSKIGEYFSAKDPIPENLLSMVVYRFKCANCNVCYVGETSRHLITRIGEHLSSDKASHIYKHLQGSLECKNACNNTCFSVLDHAATPYSLKLKEAIHISFLKPELNKQIFNYGVTLTI